jgi:hypothetical protein
MIRSNLSLAPDSTGQWSRPGAPRPREYALTSAFARGVPPELSIAWLAIAPLYVLSPRGLPEPLVALLVSTTVGVFSAVVKVGVADRTRPGPAAVPPRSEGAGFPEPADPGSLPSRAEHPPPVQARRPAVTVDTVEAADRPGSTTAGRSAVEIDYGSYAVADPLELQCPNCAGFAVSTRGSPAAVAHCACCEWEWDIGDGVDPPDVVVRSWLSRSATDTN